MLYHDIGTNYDLFNNVCFFTEHFTWFGEVRYTLLDAGYSAQIYYSTFAKYIIPIMFSIIVSIICNLDPRYWVVTFPIMWGLIMLYCPEGAYDLPIPSLPGYHRFAPFWEQALALCIKIMFVEFLISSIIFYNRNLKLGK